MPKKRRRKLSPDLEKDISSAKRKVELITAIIFDIEDEEIQLEYITAFEKVKNAYLLLTALYDEVGFNDQTVMAFDTYKALINSFEEEYEL